MSDQAPQQELVDLVDIARRAGAMAYAALIEAASGKPSAVTVAAAKALIELGDAAGGVRSPAHPDKIIVTITPSEAREISERVRTKLTDLAERARQEPNCPTCGRPRTPEVEAPPAGPIVATPEPVRTVPEPEPPRPISPPRSSEPPPPVCPICGGVGHLPINCPGREAFEASQPWTRVSEGESW